MHIAQGWRGWLALAALATAVLAPAAGALAAEIVVGQVAPLTGADARQGRSYAAGLQLAFDLANRTGASPRHTFRLVSLDDKGQPAETLRATQQLLDEKRPLVLAGYVAGRGVPELVRSGLLDRSGAALVGYRSTEIQAPHPLLFSIRAGLREELDKLTRQMATVGWTKVGLLYEQGPGAAGLLSEANASAGRAGVSFVAQFPFDAAKPGGIAQAAQAFVTAAPQAILVVASGSTAGAFIERYLGEGGKARIFALSNADIEQLTQRLGDEQLRGLVISQVTPNPYKVTSGLSKTFNDALKTQPGQEPSFTMMEGFIAGKVIVEAARRLGQPPSREGMVAALNSLNQYDLGGYAVSFSPASHVGSSYVELSIVGALGKVRQ